MAPRTTHRSGGCLCGEVRFTIDAELADVLHCHCTNCRHLSGNFVAAVRCSRRDISMDETDLRWYDLDYARYGFCQTCSSLLFFVAGDRPETYSVMVGTLDDASGLELAEIWFAHEAHEHNALATDVPHYSENNED